MTLAADPEPTFVGDLVTIVATVSPNPGGGTITWSEDGVDVGSTAVGADGRASIERRLTTSGPHEYVASFSGFGEFGPSASEPYRHIVNALAETTITFDPTAVRALTDTEVTIAATLAPVPTAGSLTWTVGGVVFATTPLDGLGRASVKLRMPSGASTVEASFAGSPGFAASTAESHLTGVTLPRACNEPFATARGQGVTAAPVRAGKITFYGLTASVTPATIDYAHSPIANPSWAGFYRGLLFLVPLAVEAYVSQDSSDLSLVTAYVNAYRRNPDPGSSTPERLAYAGTVGWDEATNAGREKVLNCLVQIDPSAAASWLLDASILANLDVNRYYGIPRHRPHNHGVMANLTLIESARILNRPGLIDVAENRMLTDLTQVMDTCGMVYEQSAPYQYHNSRVWAEAAAVFDAVGRPLTAARLRGAARKMADAYDQLIAPDGRLPAIGDGNDMAASPLRPPTTTRMLCRTAGWAVARGAWTPSTTWSVVRFGPPRIQHGHDDHGSIVWYRGRHVLIDPGFYYEPNSWYGRWYKTNAAHNVLAASGLESAGGTALVRASQGTTVDSYTVRDVTAYLTRTRSIRVDHGLPLVVVLDRVSSNRTRTFSQLWHFDPSFRWDSSRGQLVATGARAGVVSMDLRTRRAIPAAASSSYVFPTSTTVRRAPMLTVSRTGTSASILSVVYLGTSSTRPVIQWYPGASRGTGVARIWWGRIHRDIAIDSTGMR